MNVTHERIECLALTFSERPTNRPDRVTYFKVLPIDIFTAPQGNFFMFGREIGIQHRVIPFSCLRTSGLAPTATMSIDMLVFARFRQFLGNIPEFSPDLTCSIGWALAKPRVIAGGSEWIPHRKFSRVFCRVLVDGINHGHFDSRPASPTR